MLRLQARAPKGIEHFPFRVERQFMVLCEKAIPSGYPMRQWNCMNGGPLAPTLRRDPYQVLTTNPSADKLASQPPKEAAH